MKQNKNGFSRFEINCAKPKPFEVVLSFVNISLSRVKIVEKVFFKMEFNLDQLFV